jgi:hypothetical protein
MLRISNGRIRRKDGGKLGAYLKAYQRVGRIKDGTPVVLITRAWYKILESRNVEHVG